MTGNPSTVRVFLDSSGSAGASGACHGRPESFRNQIRAPSRTRGRRAAPSRGPMGGSERTLGKGLAGQGPAPRLGGDAFGRVVRVGRRCRDVGPRRASIRATGRVPCARCRWRKRPALKTASASWPKADTRKGTLAATAARYERGRLVLVRLSARRRRSFQGTVEAGQFLIQTATCGACQSFEPQLRGLLTHFSGATSAPLSTHNGRSLTRSKGCAIARHSLAWKRASQGMPLPGQLPLEGIAGPGQSNASTCRYRL